MVPINAIDAYVRQVADHFSQWLGSDLVDVYKIGSLCHGGFSDLYSDLDVGVILSCREAPAGMEEWIAGAKSLHSEYGKKLSVFWGNPDCEWGRLPVIDRLDLLDHAVSLLNHHQLIFARPSPDAVRAALRQSIEKSWKRRLPELQSLPCLQFQDRKPYIRAILYPARLIYTWDQLAVDSNDRAVEYLKQIQPARLDLKPIEQALVCRRGGCSAEAVFDLRTDLQRQFEAAISYISR